MSSNEFHDRVIADFLVGGFLILSVILLYTLWSGGVLVPLILAVGTVVVVLPVILLLGEIAQRTVSFFR